MRGLLERPRKSLGSCAGTWGAQVAPAQRQSSAQYETMKGDASMTAKGTAISSPTRTAAQSMIMRALFCQDMVSSPLGSGGSAPVVLIDTYAGFAGAEVTSVTLLSLSPVTAVTQVAIRRQ